MINLKTRFIYYDNEIKNEIEKLYDCPCWLKKGDRVFFDFTDFEVQFIELKPEIDEIRIELQQI